MSADPKDGSLGAIPGRKASKKSSKKSVSSMPSLPLENIVAEPKPTTEVKRSSKKRTTPTIEPSNNPVIDEAAIEEEKRKKREIKKQKAKEKEMMLQRQKEMEEQALQDAARKEQQRQAALRQQQQLAELNANAEECQEDLDDNNDYEEDDFEDYDDDFEADPDEDEIAPPKKSAVITSVRVAKPQQQKKTSDEDVKGIRDALDAENAAVKKKEVKEVKVPVVERKKKSMSSMASSMDGLKRSLNPRAKRVKDLRDLKEISVEKFDIFHQNPLTAHDTYMRNLRATTIRQVMSQTNDDARTMEIQTDEIDTTDQSMQFPDDIGMGQVSNGGTSSVEFAKFLQKSAQVIEILLEENNQEAILETGGSKDRRRGETRETVELNGQDEISDLIQNRDIADTCFAPDVSHMLLVAYEPTESGMYSSQSLLVLWDINNTDYPFRLLLSEGHVTCCGMNPGRWPNIAVAGTSEGCLELWDIRNVVTDTSVVVHHEFGPKIKMLRPSYSTHAEPTTTHASRIVDLQPVSQTKSNSVPGSSFQFASLDDRGCLNIWTVIGAQAESSIQLVKAASINTTDLFPMRLKTLRLDEEESEYMNNMKQIGPSVSTVRFFPNDPSQYLIGTLNGEVLRGCRFGPLPAPKTFCLETCPENDSPSTSVSSISFNAYLPSCFLVGYSNGIIG